MVHFKIGLEGRPVVQGLRGRKQERRNWKPSQDETGFGKHIAEVGELKRVIKKLKNKDADIQKTNKKIIKQHDRLFDLIEGNSSNNSSYSYGD